ncbi:MAG: putative Ig domain-containing protein, partial [Candidatus Sulfotelmatobacter sp.]
MSKIKPLLACRNQQFWFTFRVFAAVHLLAAITGLTSCGNLPQSTTASTTSTGNTTPRITLTPASASIPSGGTQQFTALVENTSNTEVVWSASAGKISSTGLFYAPTVTTSQSFVVVATSVATSSSSAKVTATVVPAQALEPLRIVTSSLVSGASGISYSATLAATGGLAPYQWTLASGALPSGLKLSDSTGNISGVPSPTGSFPFTVTVKDGAGNKTTQAMALAVSPNSAGSFDGPAELPRVYLQTTLADTPAPGKTIRVNAGGDFQAALIDAGCGDTIALQAGATFGGVFYFPQKSCDAGHWIIVRTSAPDNSLPPEQTRITPCYAGVASLPGRPSFQCSATQNVMAKLVFVKKAGDGPVVFESGANHYRLIGLEITRTAGTSISNLISPDKDAAVDSIVLDRLWVHGTAQDETARGAYLSGITSVAVIDSFFTDFHCVSKTGACIDAQAIAGGAGDLPTGPFKIVDNFLEGSGENIIFGGGAATITPTDIEVRRNHLFKPLTWMPGHPGFVGGTDGNPFIVKNLFEIKNAQRVLFEANVLENNWGGVGQFGYALELTPKNQASGTQNVCPICLVTDVTIRYSTISHVGGVFVIANAASSAGGVPADGERYSIHDVIADDIDD